MSFDCDQGLINEHHGGCLLLGFIASHLKMGMESDNWGIPLWHINLALTLGRFWYCLWYTAVDGWGGGGDGGGTVGGWGRLWIWTDGHHPTGALSSQRVHRRDTQREKPLTFEEVPVALMLKSLVMALDYLIHNHYCWHFLLIYSGYQRCIRHYRRLFIKKRICGC